MKQSSILLVLVFCLFHAFIVVSAQVNPSCAINNSLIPNGDFNDISTGMPYTSGSLNFAPSPWSKFNTPDLSTETEVVFDVNTRLISDPSFDFNVSPTGGSFIGFRTSRFGLSTSDEGIYSALTVTDASEEVVIRFDYTEANISGNSLSSGVRIQFRINATTSSTGSLIANVPNLTTTGGMHGVWEERIIIFRPSDFGISDGDTVNFYLGANDSTGNIWAFVDGIGVVNTSSSCYCASGVNGPRFF